MNAPRAAAKNAYVAFSQRSTTTTMPFLYQTRTLSRLTWKRPDVVCQSRGRSLCSNFSSSSRCQILIHPNAIPTTTAAPKVNCTNGTFSIKRTSNMSGVEPPPAGNWEFDRKTNSFGGVNEEQPGFRIRKHLVGSPKSVEGLEGGAFESIEFDEDFEEAAPDNDEIQALTKTHQTRGSTVTVTERRAFQRIFTDIFEQRSGYKNEDIFGDDIDGVDADSRKHAKSKLDNVLVSSMNREPSSAREGLEVAVERYPPALRAAAARAMGLIEDAAHLEVAASKQGTALNTEQLELMREPERIRVEGLMTTTQSDFELWEILEKEVFTLIAKLGLEDAPTTEGSGIPKKTKNKKKGEKKLTTEPEVESAQGEMDISRTDQVLVSNSGQQVSPLSLYGPLYPSYLLFGLRLLDRGFAKPSPLALSLLPRIKSLGFISHALGATTQFYNELLCIYRYRQDDFRGMLNLLTEMEHSALDLNQETLKVVADVMRTQISVHRNEKGDALKALWSMPEFAPNKFHEWRYTIQQAIDQKEAANGEAVPRY